MIFTYAIFIPNNWRRAAKVIIPMAMAPMVVPWILGLFHPESYAVAVRAANIEQVSEHALFLLVGAFTAIFGTHTINTLRKEALPPACSTSIGWAGSSAGAAWARSSWPSISCSSGHARSS